MNRTGPAAICGRAVERCGSRAVRCGPTAWAIAGGIPIPSVSKNRQALDSFDALELRVGGRFFPNLFGKGLLVWFCDAGARTGVLVR